MEAHYTLLSDIFSLPHEHPWIEAEKMAMAVLLGVGLLAVGKFVSGKLQSKEQIEHNVVPARGFSVLGVVDFLVEAFVNYHDSILGKENRRYVSFTGSVFLFLLSANFLGLVPGTAGITTTVWVNVGVALTVFLYFNYLGIKEHGLGGYLKHFCGPNLFIAPLLFPVEIFSTCLRVVTLNLRLYWNITADHLVLAVFTDKLGLPLAGVCTLVLGTFVSFMQAFIFTTLSMVYVFLAVQHDEEH